jgi:xanthine/uracil permease
MAEDVPARDTVAAPTSTPTSAPTGSVAEQQYAALLRGSLIPTLVAAVVCAAVAVPAGARAVSGAVFGAALVLVFFSLGLLVMRRTARLNPDAVMGVVMLTYVLKVAALAVVLLLFKDAAWLDPRYFALGALGCTFVWLGFEMRAFTRLRVLVSDEPADRRPGVGR